MDSIKRNTLRTRPQPNHIEEITYGQNSNSRQLQQNYRLHGAARFPRIPSERKRSNDRLLRRPERQNVRGQQPLRRPRQPANEAAAGIAANRYSHRVSRDGGYRRQPKPFERYLFLYRLMALAIHFDGLIRKGIVRDYADLARLGCITSGINCPQLGWQGDRPQELAELPRHQRP